MKKCEFCNDMTDLIFEVFMFDGRKSPACRKCLVLIADATVGDSSNVSLCLSNASGGEMK